MSAQVERDPGGGRYVALLLLLVGFAVLGVAATFGYKLYRQHDPFVNDRPDNRDAMTLLKEGRNRPLRPEEFDRALKLLGSAEPLAQLSVIALLQVEAKRDPARREPVLAALAKCQYSEEPGVIRAAQQAVERMNAATPTTTKGP